MAYHFYVAATGAKQGPLVGSSTSRQYKGQIVGLAMSHAITAPRDSSTGLSTGKRVHQPLVFTKAWDRSTPLLFSALVTNEVLSTCTFTFVRSGRDLGDVAEFTIILTNAGIAGINQYTANPDQVNQFGATELEDVSFTYQKIEWTFVDGGKTAADDWEAPAT